MDKQIVHFSSTSVSSSSPIFSCRGFLCSHIRWQTDRQKGRVRKIQREDTEWFASACYFAPTFLYLCGKVNLSMVVWTAPLLTLPSRSSSCNSSWTADTKVNKQKQTPLQIMEQLQGFSFLNMVSLLSLKLRVSGQMMTLAVQTVKPTEVTWLRFCAAYIEFDLIWMEMELRF